MLLRFMCFVLLPMLLVAANSRQKRAAKIEDIGITIQDRQAQEVADRCFNPGPCDANTPFRTIDGSCNNLNFPMWGLTNSAAIRARPANYSDGKTLPRLAASGGPLPNAREVRLKLIPSKNVEDRRYWTLFTAWAQFVSHDTGHSTPKREGLKCCTEDGKVRDAFSDLCFPIQVSRNDSFYSRFKVECIDMFRAKTVRELGCDISPDMQIVDVTHFIDASQVYGSNKTVADSVRLFEKGLLRFQLFKQEQFPPNVENPKDTCDIREEDLEEVCYLAGDKRVNQNSVLTPLHILLLRIHNKIALQLSKINPQWNDERVYQETRRIVIAIVQLITYKEFLPILIGENIIKKLELIVKPNQGFEHTYDPFLNPSTGIEFMTAAYRSLHTIITQKVRMVPKSRRERVAPEIEMVDWMERPSIVQRFYPQFLRGQQIQFIQKYDKFEPFSINNLLFHGVKPWGIDLESISIQRQTDFGIPGYNDMRIYSQLPRAKDFADLADVIDVKDIDLLRSVYSHVDDIDFYTGGLYERPHDGGLVGITFHKLIAEQFLRWKTGDRFYFTHGGQAGSFTAAQLAEIVKLGSGWMFCFGDEEIGRVHPNNMNREMEGNREVPCSQLPTLDLLKWKE